MRAEGCLQVLVVIETEKPELKCMQHAVVCAGKDHAAGFIIRRARKFSVRIVGIDLGTTFSSLAMLNAIGKPEIIPNADGYRLTPSAIFFDEENPGVIRVGAR